MRVFKSVVFQLFLNYSGVGYTLGTIIVLLLTNAYFTCPKLYGEEQCQTPIFFGYLLIFEIIINFIMFHYHAKYNKVTSLLPDAKRLPPPVQFRQNNSNIEPYINPNSTVTQNVRRELEPSPIPRISDDYTKYCYTCQMTVPQRCHHCPLCNYCILRKDHHCFLTGACVGFGNQRYFVVFLFWATIGAAYGTLYTARYLNAHYQPIFPFGWIDYIFPLAIKKWIFVQHCSVFQLGMVLIFSLGASGAGAAASFFVTQWYFILKGRTMFENDKSKFTNDGASISQRIAAIFGPYWFINFIFPSPYKNKMDESFKKIVYDYYVKEL